MLFRSQEVAPQIKELETLHKYLTPTEIVKVANHVQNACSRLEFMQKFDEFAAEYVPPRIANKKYLIQGISHNISNGTFTTTLSLKLLAPNLDIPYLSDLGGNGCGSLDGNFEDADAPTVE